MEALWVPHSELHRGTLALCELGDCFVATGALDGLVGYTCDEGSLGYRHKRRGADFHTYDAACTVSCVELFVIAH